MGTERVVYYSCMTDGEWICISCGGIGKLAAVLNLGIFR